jgi:hypothetical protein
MKLVIILIIIVGVILEICNEIFLKNRSRIKKPIRILIILLTATTLILTTFFYDPTLKNFGALRPRQNGYNKENNDKFALGLSRQTIKLAAPLNTITQPFGPYIYLTLVKTKEGLNISTRITSLDNKVVAKMVNNQWVLNPNNYFRKYYDESALEIIDEYEIPILQIEYVDSDTVKVGGIFRAENDLVSKIDSDFPAVKDPNTGRGLIRVAKNGIIIVGQNGLRAGGNLENLPLDEFIAEAKTVIKPWFDYSNPQRPSKRR